MIEYLKSFIRKKNSGFMNSTITSFPIKLIYILLFICKKIQRSVNSKSNISKFNFFLEKNESK